MAETRTCTICGETKPLEKFQKSKRSKGGRRNQCTRCRNTAVFNRLGAEEFRRRRRAWAKTPSGGKALATSNKKWRQSAKGRAYEQSPKRRACHNALQAKYRKLNPEKAAARRAVKLAKQRGLIPRCHELSCRFCGKTASEYHHHYGYAPEHHLDVIPLCKPCHVAAG